MRRFYPQESFASDISRDPNVKRLNASTHQCKSVIVEDLLKKGWKVVLKVRVKKKIDRSHFVKKVVSRKKYGKKCADEENVVYHFIFCFQYTYASNICI